MAYRDQISRRNVLRTVGTGSLATMAGCAGDGGNGGNGGNGSQDSADLNMATVFSEDLASVYPISVEENSEAVDPQPTFAIHSRVGEATDGVISSSMSGAGGVCAESECLQRATDGTLQIINTSLSNSTRIIPENHAFILPDLFPSRASMGYTLTREETWRRYMIPVAKKYGVIPICYSGPKFRNLWFSVPTDERVVTSPDDMEGLEMRRTQSNVASKVSETWGATPVQVSAADLAESLDSGLVNGWTVWVGSVNLGGAGPLHTQGTIVDAWAGGHWNWVNVEWLQDLPSSARTDLAELTKDIYHDLLELAHLQLTESGARSWGLESPPPDGTFLDRNEIQVNELTAEQEREWMDRVSFEVNPEMWSDEVDTVDDLTDEPGFIDYLYDTARSDNVPDVMTDIEIEGWWDDVIDDI